MGIDINDDFQKTYEFNNNPSKFLQADIRKLSVENFLDLTGELNPGELLLAACAPCQPFTKLKRNVERGSEGTLLGQLGRFIQALQPKYVIVENVPGLARVKGASTYRRLKNCWFP
jgi:DNA (cytosine-5)-methyltransferase 1